MIDRETHTSRRGSVSPASGETPTGPTIRVATERDLSIVVELRLALLREHADNPLYANLRPDAPERARRLFATQLRSPNEVILLAEREGRVVGILRCLHAASLPLVSPASHGYISSVYVIPEARRQGVLRALVAAALDWCLVRGLTEVRLHNAVENAAANAAWESLGFRTAEHLRVRRLR